MKHIVGMVLILGLAVFGCAKDEENAIKPKAGKTTEKPKTPDKATPKAMKLDTPEKRVERFKACWGFYLEKKNDDFKGCYADSTNMVLVDSEPPMSASNPDEVIKISSEYQAGFPDSKVAHQLILINGSNIASIHHQVATNSGPMMGMPATNKKIGLFRAQVTDMGDDGKAVKDLHWVDQMSMMKQLGMLPPKAGDRSADMIDKGWDQTHEVIAKDDDTERANVETVKNAIGMVAKGDIKGLLALSADDVMWHYVAGNDGPQTGKDAYKKAVGEFIGMTSERKLDIASSWGAGDWVVAEVIGAVTFSVDMGPIKTKGKTSTQHEIHFFQLADGKIKKHILFGNDLHMAVQLGMIDPAKLMPAKGDPAKDAPSDKAGGAKDAPAKDAKKAAPDKAKAAPDKK